MMYRALICWVCFFMYEKKCFGRSERNLNGIIVIDSISMTKDFLILFLIRLFQILMKFYNREESFRELFKYAADEIATV